MRVRDHVTWNDHPANNTNYMGRVWAIYFGSLIVMTSLINDGVHYSPVTAPGDKV